MEFWAEGNDRINLNSSIRTDKEFPQTIIDEAFTSQIRNSGPTNQSFYVTETYAGIPLFQA